MDESKLLGISIRGWITIFLTITVCTMSSWGNTIGEPLYSAFTMALGFYLGQKKTGV